jgi:hypothetical protein
VIIRLTPGANVFTYVGQIARIDLALAPLAGLYESVQVTQPGGQMVAYVPGVTVPQQIATGSRVLIVMKQAATFTMTPPLR